MTSGNKKQSNCRTTFNITALQSLFTAYTFIFIHSNGFCGTLKMSIMLNLLFFKFRPHLFSTQMLTNQKTFIYLPRGQFVKDTLTVMASYIATKCFIIG